MARGGGKIIWLKGEQDVMSLCKRFNIDATIIITSYREFFSDPRNIPSLIGERLLKGLIQIVPVSSAEAERGFSQMNLVCTKSRSSISVSHLSSLMFISVNGPPVQFWATDIQLSNNGWNTTSLLEIIKPEK